ncbi:AAA family ATPase [Planococcus antarcticus DSM 14505]|uniref:AAA family ATPase n=1 Tax=Planococcus antarcticus DSM 14505 TaxID=1185653 RepID=A0ABM6D9V5_9BACL|nr:AAA family ATPase [Planococcus antarcticus DSM 14505]
MFICEIQPFSWDIPTAELYESNQLEEIIGRLNYAAELQLFAVMTAECGLGKMTAIRRFTDQLDPSRFKLLYLSDSKLTPRHFYKGMLEQLGLESKFYRGDAKCQLHREIELMKGIHKLTPVCVVDEAHLLDREMLEEVLFLLNFRMDAQSLMALIMVGQTELWDCLQFQSFAAIRQRIDIQFRLHHLDRAETEQYMIQHLAYAGVGSDIFSKSAIDEVFNYSSGASRLINKLATHCLLFAAQNGNRIIDDRMVKKVIEGELA